MVNLTVSALLQVNLRRAIHAGLTPVTEEIRLIQAGSDHLSTYSHLGSNFFELCNYTQTGGG
jgi:hypothetical protein